MKKDNSKFWCKFCRVFVYDNKVSRSNHDKHPGHKANVERFIREIETKKSLEAKTTNMAKRLLGIPLDASDKKSASNSNSSVYVPTTADLNDDPGSFHKKAQGFAENRSSVGAVGDWQSVVAPLESSNKIESSLIESSQMSKESLSTGITSETDKMLELRRSILSSSDHNDTSLLIKSAVIESNDGDTFTIKRRQIKGKFTRKK